MLNRSSYFIREHVGMLKLSDTYDILDPQTSEQIGIAKEKPGGLVHALRFVTEKRVLPTHVYVYEGNDPDDNARLVFSIHRGFTFIRSRVDIRDAQGALLGYFKTKFVSLGGAFTVYDAQGGEVAAVKGDWKGWNFSFLDGQKNEMGKVTKKWSGIGKELFTTADNYMIFLNGEPSPALSLLLLAAGLAVDVIYGE